VATTPYFIRRTLKVKTKGVGCEGLHQKDTPGQCCVPLYAFLSYRSLSPHFQFSPSAVTLGIYVSGYDRVTFCYSRRAAVTLTRTRCTAWFVRSVRLAQVPLADWFEFPDSSFPDFLDSAYFSIFY
jgi:hypothetical protein